MGRRRPHNRTHHHTVLLFWIDVGVRIARMPALWIDVGVRTPPKETSASLQVKTTCVAVVVTHC